MRTRNPVQNLPKSTTALPDSPMKSSGLTHLVQTKFGRGATTYVATTSSVRKLWNNAADNMTSRKPIARTWSKLAFRTCIACRSSYEWERNDGLESCCHLHHGSIPSQMLEVGRVQWFLMMSKIPEIQVVGQCRWRAKSAVQRLPWGRSGIWWHAIKAFQDGWPQNQNRNQNMESGTQGNKSTYEWRSAFSSMNCRPLRTPAQASHTQVGRIDQLTNHWRAEKMFRNNYDNDSVTLWAYTSKGCRSVLINTSSPQGRIFQVEYAQEAVKQGSVVVGLVSKTHVVLTALKVSIS